MPIHSIYYTARRRQSNYSSAQSIGPLLDSPYDISASQLPTKHLRSNWRCALSAASLRAGEASIAERRILLGPPYLIHTCQIAHSPNSLALHCTCCSTFTHPPSINLCIACLSLCRLRIQPRLSDPNRGADPTRLHPTHTVNHYLLRRQLKVG